MMQGFVDLRMCDARWFYGVDGKPHSPLDAINDALWTGDWLPGNDEDFGNPEIDVHAEAEEAEPERQETDQDR